MTATEQFKALVETMLARSNEITDRVASDGARRRFGSTSIKTGVQNGKMFAFLNRKTEQLVVKLPEARVAELVEAGEGKRYDPGDGRLQREWMVVGSSEQSDWERFAVEAEAYVAARKR